MTPLAQESTDRSRRRTVLPALVLLAATLVTLGLWFIDQEETKSLPQPTQEGSETIASGQEELAPIPMEPEGPASTRTEAVSTSAEAPAVPEPDAPPRLTVRVVDGGGQPVNGIPVLLWQRLASSDRWEPDAADLQISGEGPEPSRTSSPPTPAGCCIWSSRSGLLHKWQRARERDPSSVLQLGAAISVPGEEVEILALELSPWPSSPVDLVLTPEAQARAKPLRVEVVHADGSPAAGVPVSTLAIPSDPALGNVSERPAAISDEDGIAWVPRTEPLRLLGFFELMMRRNLEPGQAPAVDLERMLEWYVAPDLPLTTRPREAFAGLATDEETVRLQLPPLVRMRARAIDAEGRPFDAQSKQLTYRLQWTRAPEPPENRESLQTVSGTSTQAEFDLGWIEAGLEVNLRAWPVDHSIPTAYAKFTSPSRSGSEDVVLLEFGPPYPVLFVTLLDPDGSPLIAQQVQYLVRDAETSTERRHWRTRVTDEEGRLHWMRQQEPRVPRLLEVRHERDGAEWFASRELPQALEALQTAQGHSARERSNGLRHNLGRLALENRPLPDLTTPGEQDLCAAGLVTDSSGQPIEGVQLWMRHAESRINIGSVITDAAGRFELLSEQAGESLTLELYAEGYLPWTSPPSDWGIANWTFSLERSGTLVGRVTGQGQPIHIYATSGSYRGRVRVDDKGGLRITGLPSGPARIELRTDSPSFLLERIEDLEVVAGEERSAPALDPLRLEGRTRILWLLVRDSGQQPLDGDLRIEIEGYERASLDLGNRQRRALVVPGGTETLQLSLRGYETHQLDLVPDVEEYTVHLQEGR